MTTQIIAFSPSDVVAFQFSVPLDANVYTATVKWNLFGQRYYITISDSGGTIIFTRAMVTSPPDSDISLTWGYFDTALVLREDTQVFETIP
jgi:hypothetical protein